MELVLVALLFATLGAIAGFVFGRHSVTSDEQRLLAEFDRLSRATLATTSADLVKTAEQNFRLAQAAAERDADRQRFSVEQLVRPVQDNLDKLERYLQQSEEQRNAQYGGLFQQMRDVAESSARVQSEAAALKNVLRSSSATRGRWGEVQLRRVVELAGMLEHADFAEQRTASDEDGTARADLLCYLPGNLHIAVDAKVPYRAYEQAHTIDEPVEQKRLLVEHARQFRAHVDSLAKRAYWERYQPTCGFCVLFVPGEALLDSALAHDAKLWERAAEKNILLATPSTLIALLRMAALGWRQEQQAENAEEITRQGRELYKRLKTVTVEVEKMGRGLGAALKSYNAFVGSFDGRLMPQARRLSDLGAGDGTITVLPPLDGAPRVTVGSEIELEEYAEES